MSRYREIQEGSDVIYVSDVGAVSFSTIQSPRGEKETDIRTFDSLAWNDRIYNIGDYAVFPYGDTNDLPDIIRDVIYNNYIAPGLLTKKRNLLWGNGPRLYREEYEGNQIIRVLERNKEIESWLESFDYESYLLKCLKDYNHIESVTTKFELGKGFDFGKNFISKLEHIPVNKVRKAALSGSTNHIEGNPTHVIVSKVSGNVFTANEFGKVYPLFDYRNPYKYKNSVMYSNEYSFGIDIYTLPDIFGALEWLRRSTATPLILKAFTDNSINLKFHVESPQLYWDRKKEDLKRKCEESGLEYNDSMMVAYTRKVFDKITSVLSGADNSGKMWHTIKLTGTDGEDLKEYGWTIKAIDQNVKDFITAQIDVSKRADYAVGASVGLHSALGNISETGKSDSGSEQLYAHQTYLATNINVPEIITTKAINTAIKLNFPEADLKIGFHQVGVRRQQNETPSERLINQ